jgi:hypothetical protein
MEWAFFAPEDLRFQDEVNPPFRPRYRRSVPVISVPPLFLRSLRPLRYLLEFNGATEQAGNRDVRLSMSTDR